MATQCWGLPAALCEFPSLDNSSLREMRKSIDGGFRDLVRTWSEVIDAATAPLQVFLNTLENAFVGAPWIVVLVVLTAVVWAASRSWKTVVGTAIAMCGIGYFGLWEDTMVTLAMVTVCTIVAVIIGLPVGILAARSGHHDREGCGQARGVAR